jgi:hypothetical protein
LKKFSSDPATLVSQEGIKGALTEKLFGKPKPLEEPKMKVKFDGNYLIIESELNDAQIRSKLEI